MLQAITSHPRVRRPITLKIMQDIKSVLLSQSHCYHNAMIWAAYCLAFFGFLKSSGLAFFGFLKSSEFTVPAQHCFDNSIHLSPQDIAIDCRHSPGMIKVSIKQFKTDLFRQGVNLYLGKTDKDICPVNGNFAISGYRRQPTRATFHGYQWKDAHPPDIQY